jgi:hypothetical protein
MPSAMKKTWNVRKIASVAKDNTQRKQIIYKPYLIQNKDPQTNRGSFLISISTLS